MIKSIVIGLVMGMLGLCVMSAGEQTAQASATVAETAAGGVCCQTIGTFTRCWPCHNSE